MIRALVFDFDGVLVDTESIYRASFEVAGERLGYVLDTDEFEACLARDVSDETLVRRIFGCMASAQTSVICDVARSYREVRRSRLTPMPGSVRLLAEARDRGLYTAIATNATRGRLNECLDGVLRTTGVRLMDMVDHVVTADDVKVAKPAPEMYRRVVFALGRAAHESVAFEDSTVGVEAAVEAGLHCAVVGDAVLPLSLCNRSVRAGGTLEFVSVGDVESLVAFGDGDG